MNTHTLTHTCAGACTFTCAWACALCWKNVGRCNVKALKHKYPCLRMVFTNHRTVGNLWCYWGIVLHLFGDILATEGKGRIVGGQKWLIIDNKTNGQGLCAGCCGLLCMSIAWRRVIVFFAIFVHLVVEVVRLTGMPFGSIQAFQEK